ncbi:hypothetical protein [Sulfurimonas sp.]|uniref:hypothetical protein n=1 Tax=Sulfurimonas sp. TaxID=2022749 RepID=UPI0019FEBA60|nr:hypothetical protein [Sulfurimonas sp.]MBE0514980.1 hypothetical protein [Sulfurimonas sp.]
MNRDIQELKDLIVCLEHMIEMNHKEILKKIDSLSCNDRLITKEEAAEVISCEKQMIKKLEYEGRITNYGRGSFLRYRKSELLDLREVRNG